MYITERLEAYLNRATQDFDGRDEMMQEAVDEINRLRRFLFPYADRIDISGTSWDGKYLIGDKESIQYFHEMQNRGLQIDVYRKAYEERISALENRTATSDKIADAVLSWMVKYDLLDAGNEYQAEDVLAVLDGFVLDYHAQRPAPSVAMKALRTAIHNGLIDGAQLESDLQYDFDRTVDNILSSVLLALSAQVQDVASKADPCTFPKCNCFDTNVCGKGGGGEFKSFPAAKQVEVE